VLFNLGLALYHSNRLDEAFNRMEAASFLSVRSPEPLYYLGLIASARGQAESAISYWEKALTLRPDFAEVNFMIGEELRKSHRIEGAKEFYERALAQDSSKAIYHIRLGGVYLLLKLPGQALEVFTRARQRFPEVAELNYFVGIAARAKGDYTAAEAALRRMLALQPENFDALAQLGFIMGERGDYKEAEALLRRAIALNDKHFYAHYDLGRLLVKAKRLEEAIPILERGAALMPSNPGVHYQLFMAFSRLKRKDEAERELAIFKRMDAEGKTRKQDDDVEKVVNESSGAGQTALPETGP
jgi:tetratricopeptide (TPR) repeat protein